MGIVHGRALFVRRWGTLPGAERLSARQWAELYRSLGFEWACVIIAWGGTGEGASDVNRQRDYYAALRDVGVDVWTCWALPTPMDSERALGARAEGVLDFSESVGATGLVIDPERGWRSLRDRAAYLNRKCHQRAALRYGFTSYGNPAGQPGFPFREFLAGCDLTIPQTYDRDLNFRASYARDAIRAYRDRGAPSGTQFAMGAGTWVHRGTAPPDGRPKTPDELRRHLALLPDGPIIAWPYGTLPESALRLIATAPLGRAAPGPRRGPRGGAGAGLAWALGAILAALGLAAASDER